VTALAPTLEAFFTQRLTGQRQASPHTIAAYRDTFRLLLHFARDRTGKNPCQLDLADLDAPLIAAFLTDLEARRGNSPRTRNARLAAIHSLFRYAALRHPEHAALISRVLAIPPKRFQRDLVTFLAPAQAQALLAAPDQSTRPGRRDHALLTLAIQTGLRVSEIAALRRCDVTLGTTGAHVRCHGKGRKERITPLTTQTTAVLRAWTREHGGEPAMALFPGPRGQPLTRSAIEHLVTRHATTAAASCPSLRDKHISPHTLRHTAAMQLLHAGIDIAVIALWLDHENTETTQIYLHADLTLKERALARTTQPGTTPGRYKPPDTLLAFLESL
jgi:site-specific recombinase XerD